MVWLWAVTAFSASTAVVTGIGWWVTWYKLDRARWEFRQFKKSANVHQCDVHGPLYAGAEVTDRAKDLDAIRRRWEHPYRNRTD